MRKYFTAWHLTLYAAIIILLCLQFCERQDADTVIVPEQKGTFAPVVNPEPLPAPPPVVKYIKGDTLRVPSKVNEELYDLYMASYEREQLSKDTISQQKERLAQMQLTVDALAEHDYENLFENSKMSVLVKSKTQGKLLSIVPEWTIKADTVKLKRPLRVFAGPTIDKDGLRGSVDVQYGKLLYKASVNLKGDIQAGASYRIFERSRQ